MGPPGRRTDGERGAAAKAGLAVFGRRPALDLVHVAHAHMNGSMHRKAPTVASTHAGEPPQGKKVLLLPPAKRSRLDWRICCGGPWALLKRVKVLWARLRDCLKWACRVSLWQTF